MTYRSLYFLLFSVLSVASAEVDPSLGTYSCYPCGRAMCGFTNGGSEDIMIDTSAIAGSVFDRAPPRSCKEIQNLADQRKFDPEVCSIYSQITLSLEDPCDCKKRTRPFAETSTNEECTNPNQAQPCELCGRGKIIGDPEKFISDSRYQTQCIKIFDLQNENMEEGQGGFSRSMCNDLQPLFAQHCKCVTPGTPVTQCLGQENEECDPSKSDDQCCTGHCRYVHSFRRNFCTFKAAEAAPQMISSSTRPPTSPQTNNPLVGFDFSVLQTETPEVLPPNFFSNFFSNAPSEKPDVQEFPFLAGFNAFSEFGNLFNSAPDNDGYDP